MKNKIIAMTTNNYSIKDIHIWLDNKRKEIEDFCCEIIRHKSPTGRERDIQYFFYNYLKEELEPDYLKMCEKSNNRPNIIAVWRGTDLKGSGILLNGHVDVVDVSEKELIKWNTDPWTPLMINGRIYGRGASDMKGGITSMLWALKAIKEHRVKLKKNIGLELVVGEELMEHEIGTTAATKCLIEAGYKFEFAIIPEPTNLEIHVISPGAFVLEIEVTGREVHDGVRNVILYPQPWGVPSGEDVGVDAIEKIILIYEALRLLERNLVLRWKHKILGSGGYPEGRDIQGVGSLVNFNIAFIEGGTYISSVPGYAKISANCYYPPWLNFEEVKSKILEAINALTRYDEYLSKKPPKVTFSMFWPPYETDVDNIYCQKLALSYEEVTGRRKIYSGFRAVSDISFLQSLGIKGVCFGPGDLTMGAHGPNEYVPVNQLIEAAKVIATFLIKCCSK